MEPIETQEFKTSHGLGRVDYFSNETIVLSYLMRIDGQLLQGQFVVDLFASRLYVPGPLAFLKIGFEKHMVFPAPKHYTADNVDAMNEHRDFIENHGQAIIDKARELGLMGNENQT